MTGKLRDLTINRDGSQNVTVTVSSDFSKTFEALKDKTVSVEIKPETKGRSRDANAMCWALCSEIGRALKPPLPKEDIYRQAIKAVGVYIAKKLPLWSVETVRRRWESHGTGWVFEVMDDAGIGWKLCNLYFGSSTYTVQEMQVLLDWLVDQCEQMELPLLMSKKEEEELLKRWGKK